MKKALVTGALALTLLVGGSMTAYAAFPAQPSIRGINNQSGISLPIIQTPEVDESAADMSAYEKYGLTYSEAKGGYCYDGKLVGLFVDTQGRGITFLNQNGETNVKAVRDSNGSLTGLAVLTAEEYQAIISDMNAKASEIETQLRNLFR